jgi:hypothetical protein
MNIEVNGVTITLTEEQLREIERQISIPKKSRDIKSYEDACESISQDPETSPSLARKLKTIIAAANYLDNEREIWNENWEKNNSQIKYYAMFEKQNVSWSVIVACCERFAGASYGLHFKKRDTCFDIASRFKEMFLEYMNEGNVIR